MLVVRAQFGFRSAGRAEGNPGARAGRTGRTDDGGAAAVEMALVLPLLLMLIFGIIDFGRMLNKQIALTEAARDAARVASFGGSADESKAAAAERATRIAGNGIGVDTTPCSATVQDAEVTVTHEFVFITPVGLIGGGFDGKAKLTGRGVMPCQ